MKPAELVARIAPLFPSATISVASKNRVLLRSTPLDNTQIKALISGLDIPPSSAPLPTPAPVEAVDVKVAQPSRVAKAVARSVPRVAVSVSGSSILLRGDPQAIASAKTLVAQLDTAPFGQR